MLCLSSTNAFWRTYRRTVLLLVISVLCVKLLHGFVSSKRGNVQTQRIDGVKAKTINQDFSEIEGAANALLLQMQKKVLKHNGPLETNKADSDKDEIKGAADSLLLHSGGMQRKVLKPSGPPETRKQDSVSGDDDEEVIDLKVPRTYEKEVPPAESSTDTDTDTKRHAPQTKDSDINDNNKPVKQKPKVKHVSSPVLQIKSLTYWQLAMKKQCEKMGMYAPLTDTNFKRKLFNHIIVDDKHKVIYCQIPKVATMTFRRIFIVSTGKANTTNPNAVLAKDVYGKFDSALQYLSDLPLDQIKYKLQNYFKFMFVREPLERLLSAYRNKLLENSKSSSHFRMHIGTKIIKDYRPSPSVGSDKASFHEFVQYLIDHDRNIVWNEHWDQFNNLCAPCTIPYNYVGKLENSQKDANYVLHRTGLDKIALFPNRTDTDYKLKETKDILKKYYSTLPRSVLRSLIKEYEIDANLFGYTIPETIQEMLR